MCVVAQGMRGLCRSRININDILYTLNYGNLCSICADPVEKKPLYHFLPGSKVLSIASAGCNLRCLNCQNWSISQHSSTEVKHMIFTPEEVVNHALFQNIKAIAFTYTEPTVFYEFMCDTADLAKRNGIKSIMVSNGYINEDPLKQLCKNLDAANIDLKCFDTGLYYKISGGYLEPVLNSLKVLKDHGVWLEITNLIIPGWTDNLAMIENMCNWLAENGFEETPLHLSRFYPTYNMESLQATPEETIIKAVKIAIDAGIKFVYPGNIPHLNADDTLCPGCSKVLVKRLGYRVVELNLKNGNCTECSHHLKGVWN